MSEDKTAYYTTDPTYECTMCGREIHHKGMCGPCRRKLERK